MYVIKNDPLRIQLCVRMEALFTRTAEEIMGGEIHLQDTYLFQGLLITTGVCLDSERNRCFRLVISGNSPVTFYSKTQSGEAEVHSVQYSDILHWSFPYEISALGEDHSAEKILFRGRDAVDEGYAETDIKFEKL